MRKFFTMDGFDMDNEIKEVEEKTWEEFREAGLLWFINRIIHVFGWVIVWDDEKKVMYPAHTIFRGFGPATEDKGFANVTKMMMSNIDRIKQAFDPEELENKDE